MGFGVCGLGFGVWGLVFGVLGLAFVGCGLRVFDMHPQMKFRLLSVVAPTSRDGEYDAYMYGSIDNHAAAVAAATAAAAFESSAPAPVPHSSPPSSSGLAEELEGKREVRVSCDV